MSTAESAAETAAKVFETRRIEEATNGVVAKAVEEVRDLFADDDSRIRAAATIAEGVPENGLTMEAARRLVVNALRDPGLKSLLKPVVVPGSMQDIVSKRRAREEAAAKAIAGATKPAPPAPQTLAEIGERMRGLRGLREVATKAESK